MWLALLVTETPKINSAEVETNLVFNEVNWTLSVDSLHSKELFIKWSYSHQIWKKEKSGLKAPQHLRACLYVLHQKDGQAALYYSCYWSCMGTPAEEEVTGVIGLADVPCMQELVTPSLKFDSKATFNIFFICWHNIKFWCLIMIIENSINLLHCWTTNRNMLSGRICSELPRRHLAYPTPLFLSAGLFQDKHAFRKI